MTIGIAKRVGGRGLCRIPGTQYQILLDGFVVHLIRFAHGSDLQTRGTRLSASCHGEAHRRYTRMENFADGVQAYREISIMSPEFSEFCPTLKPAAG